MTTRIEQGSCKEETGCPHAGADRGQATMVEAGRLPQDMWGRPTMWAGMWAALMAGCSGLKAGYHKATQLEGQERRIRRSNDLGYTHVLAMLCALLFSGHQGHGNRSERTDNPDADV